MKTLLLATITLGAASPALAHATSAPHLHVSDTPVWIALATISVAVAVWHKFG